MLQNTLNPDSWREALAKVDESRAKGAQVYPQVAARPFGMMIGWDGYHFFLKRPTYLRLAEELDGAALRAELAKPEVKAAILAEEDAPADPTKQFDGIGAFLCGMLHEIYAMGGIPDYEPSADRTVQALAEAQGREPLELAYDLLNENGGTAFLMLPFFNLRGRQPGRHLRDVAAPRRGVGSLRRRRPRPHDLRRVDPDVRPHPLGA